MNKIFIVKKSLDRLFMDITKKMTTIDLLKKQIKNIFEQFVICVFYLINNTVSGGGLVNKMFEKALDKLRMDMTEEERRKVEKRKIKRANYQVFVFGWCHDKP